MSIKVYRVGMSAQQSPPFILVHIGLDFFPTYAVNAVKQIFTWNPDATVFFICEKKFFSELDSITSQNLFVVDIRRIRASSQHELFNKNTLLDTGFRNGFWRFTTERLYVLYDFMLSENIGECIHIENDNTIYFSTDDPEFKAVWAETKDLCAPRHAANSLTFGILFCKNRATLASLCDVLASTPTNRNEMDLGFRFFQMSPLATSFFKSAPSVASLRIADGEPHVATRSNGFVFDAACYGQLLGGIDPRNGPSRPGFINQDSFFNVAMQNTSYMWRRDLKGRRYPVVRCDDGATEFRIANLHIHSKDLAPFLSDMPIDKGENYQLECDAWVGTPDDFAFNFNILPYLNGKVTSRRPERVFVYGHRLRDFNPDMFDSSFVLVTHNSDENIDERYNALFDHPKIRKVYSQNLMTTHPKCEYIPIGQANRQWPHGSMDALLRCMGRQFSKFNMIYCNFTIGTNIGEREHCADIMTKKNIPIAPNMGYASYIEYISTFKYAICPVGNGVDTHRFWECIYLGVIPIVVRNPLITHIESAGHKMIVLNSWEELDVSTL